MEHLIRQAASRHPYRISIQNCQEKELLGRPTNGGENNIENAYTQIRRWLDVPVMGYFLVTAFVNTILNLRVHKGPKFEDQVMQCRLLEEAHLQSTVQQEKMQGRIQVLYTKQEDCLTAYYKKGSLSNSNVTSRLRTTLTNQSFILEEMKNRLKPGNACCHSVQHLSCSML